MTGRTLWTLLASALAGLTLLACPAAECEGDEQRCDGEQIQTCVDGAWGAAEDCDGTMNCMTMDDGLEHCMEAM